MKFTKTAGLSFILLVALFSPIINGCSYIKTGQHLNLQEINAPKIANKICLAIMLSDLAKNDSGFKEKATLVVSQLSKHLTVLEDGKFTLDEAFKQIRTATNNSTPLVDPKISVIVELALEDELTGYLEIPKGQNEKLQKLIEVVSLVNQKLKEIGGN